MRQAKFERFLDLPLQETTESCGKAGRWDYVIKDRHVVLDHFELGVPLTVL